MFSEDQVDPYNRLIPLPTYGPTNDELWTLYYFEQHAANCKQCHGCISDGKEGAELCAEGNNCALEVDALIGKSEKGIYIRKPGFRYQVELPDDYVRSARLLDTVYAWSKTGKSLLRLASQERAVVQERSDFSRISPLRIDVSDDARMYTETKSAQDPISSDLTSLTGMSSTKNIIDEFLTSLPSNLQIREDKKWIADGLRTPVSPKSNQLISRPKHQARPGTNDDDDRCAPALRDKRSSTLHRLAKLSASRSRQEFFEHLGWNQQDEYHRHLYTLMMEEAAAGRELTCKNKDNLTPQSRKCDPPYSASQISEVAKLREVQQIFQQAAPETREIYDLGLLGGTDDSYDNWIIRWCLWHVFRYRNNCGDVNADSSAIKPSLLPGRLNEPSSHNLTKWNSYKRSSDDAKSRTNRLQGQLSPDAHLANVGTEHLSFTMDISYGDPRESLRAPESLGDVVPYKTMNADDEDLSDLDSVFSFDAASASSKSSIEPGPASFAGVAISQVVQLFMQHQALRTLCEEAIISDLVGADRFQRNFRRLLKYYGKALAEDCATKTSSRYAAATFVMRSARLIAARVRQACIGRVGRGHPPQITSKERLLLDNRLHRFQESESSDTGGSEEDVGVEELKSLKSVEKYMLQSPAFKELYDRLCRLVHPSWSDRWSDFLERCERNRDELKISALQMQHLRDIEPHIASADPSSILVEALPVSTTLRQFQHWMEVRTDTRWNWWPLASPARGFEEDTALLSWTYEYGRKAKERVPVSLITGLQKLLDKQKQLEARGRKFASFNSAHRSEDISGQNIASQTTAQDCRPMPHGNVQMTVLNDLDTSRAPGSKQGAPSVIASDAGCRQQSSLQTHGTVFLTIKRGTYYRLAQLDVTGIKDKAFFSKLKQQYRSHRGRLRCWLSIYVYDHCEFYKVSSFHRDRFGEIFGDVSMLTPTYT